MMGASESWPVRIGAVGDVAVSPGTVVWRVRGAEEIRVSVIVKATFTIVPEGEMTPREPDPLVIHDVHHHADSQCSLRVAGDLAPYLGQAELLVTGHAYAPPERPTPMAGARVVVHRDGQVLVSKTISVQGDRRVDYSVLSDPAPFQRMPLIYERAVYHPELNPVGVDPSRGAPNLVHSGDPSLPGCFGPLGRRWPARLRLLGGLDPRQFDGARLEFPQGFAWEHLQASPPDQRLDFLHGNEGILLGGMHPTLPMVRSRLPGVHAVACVYPDRDGAGERLPLWADTLIIDTDRQVCSIVWRGNLGVTDEALLRSMRIRAGVALPSAPLIFPGEAGAPGRAPMVSIPEVPMVQPEVPEPVPAYPVYPAYPAYPAEPALAAPPPAEEIIEEIPADEIIEDVVEELPDDALQTLDGTHEGVILTGAAGGAPTGGSQAEEDEDAIITRGVGFRTPLAGPLPVQPPVTPAPAPQPSEDEDAVITPRGDRGPGG